MSETRRMHIGRVPWWRRLFGRFLGVDRVKRPAEVVADDVDSRLLRQVELRQVRRFVEGIESYRLHSRRVVHVVSEFSMPEQSGLAAQVPWWLARRLRFGIAEANGDHRYVPISGIEMVWDDGATELFLRLEETVEPGTSAFVAAYLGDGAAPESLVTRGREPRDQAEDG